MHVISDLSSSGTCLPDSLLRQKTVDGRGVADIRLMQVDDGPGRGQRLLIARNGNGIGMEIALDRGFDISSLTWRGLNLGWNSSNGLPLPTHSIDAEDGTGLYRNLDGFLVTCGLDHTGGAKLDKADHFIHKHRKRVFHPLHGRVSVQRAALRGYGIDWSTEQPRIWAEAVVRQSSVFGENLVLRRRITLGVFGSTVQVKDEVTNAGFRPTSHALLYHVNFGHPFLDRETTIAGDIPNEFKDEFNKQDKSPSPDFIDYYTAVLSCEQAESTEVSVINAELAGGAKVTVSFPKQCLPDFGVWRAYQSGVYALALEPGFSSDCVNGERHPAVLLAGEQRVYDLSIRVETLTK